ncbi:hypothetical protein GCM10007036_02910 [Alsobacter metallidurans]|uniref:Lipoprotein n=1 Tax=Alsobacter metallidurans TaxID=340221 RepID=A0A917MG36_9HYPH|nr:hypothetical protein [Alsobacter metallidurans]GGH07799.1 hypothetical protein GCM10007036_02910 [Alsobacter metallidurans]
MRALFLTVALLGLISCNQPFAMDKVERRANEAPIESIKRFVAQRNEHERSLKERGTASVKALSDGAEGPARRLCTELAEFHLKTRGRELAAVIDEFIVSPDGAYLSDSDKLYTERLLKAIKDGEQHTQQSSDYQDFLNMQRVAIWKPLYKELITAIRTDYWAKIKFRFEELASKAPDKLEIDAIRTGSVESRRASYEKYGLLLSNLAVFAIKDIVKIEKFVDEKTKGISYTDKWFRYDLAYDLEHMIVSELVLSDLGWRSESLVKRGFYACLGPDANL